MGGGKFTCFGYLLLPQQECRLRSSRRFQRALADLQRRRDVAKDRDHSAPMRDARLRRRRSWLVCGNRAAAGSRGLPSTARSMAAQAGRWSHAPRHPLAARRHRSHCRGCDKTSASVANLGWRRNGATEVRRCCTRARTEVLAGMPFHGALPVALAQVTALLRRRESAPQPGMARARQPSSISGRMTNITAIVPGIEPAGQLAAYSFRGTPRY